MAVLRRGTREPSISPRFSRHFSCSSSDVPSGCEWLFEAATLARYGMERGADKRFTSSSEAHGRMTSSLCWTRWRGGPRKGLSRVFFVIPQLWVLSLLGSKSHARTCEGTEVRHTSHRSLARSLKCVHHDPCARLHAVWMVKVKGKKKVRAVGLEAGDAAPGAGEEGVKEVSDPAETLERAWSETGEGRKKRRRLRPAEMAEVEQVEPEVKAPKAKGTKKRKVAKTEKVVEEATEQPMPEVELGGTESKEVEGEEVRAPECLKVCAANLPYWFDKDRISKHFRRAGDVQHVWLLYDKWTWESKGIAFITLGDQSSVKAALELDGTCLQGYVIRVNLAADKAEKGKGKGEGKAGKGKGKAKAPVLALADKPRNSLGLMARGLSFEVTEDDLRATFADCGSGPSRVRLLVDKAGQSKGKAFIDFQDETSLQQAVAKNETILKGRALRLEYSHAE